MFGLIPHGFLASMSIAVTLAVIDATAIGQAIIALIVVAGYVANRLNQKKTDEKVQEVHVMVNSQKAEMEGRIRKLEEKLDLKPGEEIPTQKTITETTEAESSP
jgi:hypothetical protein